MKIRYFLIGAAAILFALGPARATEFYVNGNNPNPAAPFASWDTAATNIQDAIDAAKVSDTIWVTNGIYQTGGRVVTGGLTNRVTLDKAVTVQSVNGPLATIIRGNGATNGTNAVRCAWLTNNAQLVGFTLEGGATRTSGSTDVQYGGAAYCYSGSAFLANCIIQSNNAAGYAGGVFQGSVNNCAFIGNNSGLLGAAAFMANMYNSTVVSNIHGGVYGGTLTNCIIYFNSAGANYTGGNRRYCCTTPASAGAGNIALAPQLAADGIHLNADSPCHGAGTNALSATDIFGQPWGDPPSMGCAEWSGKPTTGQPTIKLNAAGNWFTLSASIASTVPLTYYWSRDGGLVPDAGPFDLADATNQLSITLPGYLAGNYQLVLSNAYGSVTSAPVALVVHYVDPTSTQPAPPYLAWASAATNIQDAVDAAAAGEVVIVTNGLYAAGGRALTGDLVSRVTIDKPIVITSVNGWSNTWIQGSWDPISTNGPAAVRCVALTNGAVLRGFLLEQGATRSFSGLIGNPAESGGGVWCGDTNCHVFNCVLANNAAEYGGGIAGGNIDNSFLDGNSTAYYGGGAFNATLTHCLVYNNSSVHSSVNYGAGTYGGTVRNSIVYENRTSTFYEDNYSTLGGIAYTYSFTSPSVSGTGNLSASSLVLFNLYHLPAVALCRGTGSSAYGSGTDLDGDPWGNPPSMGCDEIGAISFLGPLTIGVSAYFTNLITTKPDFLFGTVTGNVSQVDWQFGDGVALTNSMLSQVHTWATAGDYPVTCIAYNDDHPEGISASTVVHVGVLAAPQLLIFGAQTNRIQFQFPGQGGANYTVQFTTNLAPPVNWQTLQNIYFNTNDLVPVTDPGATNAMRFYRILAQ
ncbi:MAG TPA: hypothetical protein VL527_02745 [Dongiaceae bacterium]|nr:hypothetical protein [Dongiaceae bacterium]